MAENFNLLHVLKEGKNSMRHFIAFFWLAFAMFIITFVVAFVLPEENKDVIYIVVGFVIAQSKDVLGFYFSTSQGSSDKAETIKQHMAETK